MNNDSSDVLKRLDTSAMRYVKRESFLKNDADQSLLDSIQNEVQELDEKIRLKDLNDVVDRVMDDYSKSNSEKSDQVLAPEIHQSLDLSRRLASDESIWHYLSVVARPDYVRFRWQKDGSVTANRFLSRTHQSTRWYRNSFARLWWGAELTEFDGDYTYTERLFQTQDLAETFLASRNFHYPPAVKAFFRALEESNKNGQYWRGISEYINLTLSTKVLEEMTENQIFRAIEDYL